MVPTEEILIFYPHKVTKIICHNSRKKKSSWANPAIDKVVKRFVNCCTLLWRKWKYTRYTIENRFTSPGVH